MQKLPLMQAKAGMVLARDVFRGNSPTGMPICGKDTLLTDALIARLENMDVQSVSVQGHPVWEEGELSYDDLQRELDRRFEKTIQDPLNAILYDIHKAHLIKSMEGEGGRQEE
ncbi:MAG: hypothetical protein PHD54_00960 [Desulfuromonadaceae bacterium]|nr:hypothetical protein [Desulfuromonadaceae bacterium]